MQETLIQQKCEALKGEALMYVILTHANKIEMEDKARSVTMLYPEDKVQMEIYREKTMNGMWVKFELLCDQFLGSQIMSEITTPIISNG